jgi:hypothetical protein
MHKYDKGIFLGTPYPRFGGPREAWVVSAEEKVGERFDFVSADLISILCMLVCAGQGAYGVVHKATPKGSDRELAIKKIRMGNITEDGVPFVGLREIKLLRELNHPNVIQVSLSRLLLLNATTQLNFS